MLLLLSSCGNLEKIKFKANPYVFDIQNSSIVNADSDYVYFNDSKIYSYACFHEVKLKELAAILSAARIPKKYKKELQKELDKIRDQKKRAMIRAGSQGRF